MIFEISSENPPIIQAVRQVLTSFPQPCLPNLLAIMPGMSWNEM